ncbi:MAG: 4Fe-4S dicluster domain-containing protein [Bacteroidia bacterium]|nr:4Fe-4S dicluster domain-containing protein [Bacteroidia bacterium]
MHRSVLKITRIVVSLIFFFITLFAFADIWHLLSAGLTHDILYLQFVPSFLKFITVPALASAGYILIILFTAIFGRIYCSSVCPLGSLQDITAKIAGWFRKKKMKFSNATNWLRYSFLALAIISIPAGSFVISLLDPFSNSGRIFNSLLKPCVVGVNNLFAKLLIKSGSYGMSMVDDKMAVSAALVFSLCFLVLITILVIRNGRIFCNTVCPVGTMLGFITRFSLFRFRINNQTCTNCFRCEVSCKSGCIDSKNEIIDSSRCVSCFNCMNACSSGAIKYSISRKASYVKTPVVIDDGRRDKLKLIFASVFAFSGFSFIKAFVLPEGKGLNTTRPVKKKYQVTPPGSLSLKYFGEKCTACHLCVSACPSQVIRPSFMEYGLQGIFQAHMDYNSGYCNFECTLCTEVCPSGALLPVSKTDKKLLQLGKSYFIKENCIVFTDNTDCGACSEHCPTKAVHMVPYKGKLKIPEVNNKICVGCGACEYACPVKPFKAIYVDGNPVHLLAQKPEEKQHPKKNGEDFPF